MQSIFEKWKSYRQRVMPVHASEFQVTETKRAFFAGAQALFTLLVSGVSDEEETTEGDLSFMASIDAELKDFNNRVKAGKE